jgi:alkylation response protein AidB-like acyl-CoA dehydrogenase
VRGPRKGSGTPTRRGDRKPRVSVFAQVSIVAGYAGAAAHATKIFTIFEGTSEIQRMIIGRAVTGLDVR